MARHGARSGRPIRRNVEVVCGRQPVTETFRAGRRKIHRLLLACTNDGPEFAALVRDAEAKGIPVDRVDRRSLDRLTDGQHHQSVAVEATPYPYAAASDILRVNEDGDGVWLLLDHIEDPQNLGSLLRTAEAAGVRGVVLPTDRAAGVTEAVVRVSAGASEHLQVCRIANLVNGMRKLRKQGVRLVGLEAGPESTSWAEIDLTGALGMVVGSEGRGLGRLVREQCDALVCLPMEGRVGSLNAAVSGAIVLYEALRQRGEGLGVDQVRG